MSKSLAVIYARYSSAGQREVSLDQQEKVCREYAKNNGMVVLRVYSDAAMTGKNDHRPQFQQMIKDSAKHDFTTVIVYATDRFSRKTLDAVVNKERLRANGVRVISATEPISDNPAGVLTEAIFQGLAEYYSLELSQKIRRGQEYNASKFLAPGSVPYGFYRSPDGHYVVNEQEAAVVREIFDAMLAGDDQTTICNRLNERGLKTKKGTPFSYSSMYSILHNERYIGTFIFNDVKTEDAIPQIVDKNTYWKVQDMLNSKPLSSNRRRNKNGIYLLTGRLYCSECGQKMTGISSTSKSGNLYYYYECAGHRAHSGCTLNRIRRDYLEMTIANGIHDIALTDDNILWMAQESHKIAVEDSETDDPSFLQDQLRQAEQAEKGIMKAIEAGMYNESMKQRMQELDNQISIIQAKLQTIEEERSQIPTVEQIVTTLRLFRDGDVSDPHITQGLLDAFVTRAVLFRDHVTIYYEIKKEASQKDVPIDWLDGDGDGCAYRLSPWTSGALKRTQTGFMLQIALAA